MRQIFKETKIAMPSTIRMYGEYLYIESKILIRKHKFLSFLNCVNGIAIFAVKKDLSARS